MMRKRTGLMAASLLVAALALAACGGGAAPATEEAMEEEMSDEEMMEEEEMSDEEMMDEEEMSDEEMMDEEAMSEEEMMDEMGMLPVQSEDVDVTSGGQPFASYLAYPAEGGPYPGIILIHSFNGLEPGYRTLVDNLASEGFVVLALGWQTYERSPSDAATQQLVEDGIALLTGRDDVRADSLGLTGFCAGGRYTMLYLPQIEAFKAGVAWYGFPYSGDPAPADLIDSLAVPMLMIHGTNDQPSPIADIERYAGELEAAGKTIELEVYEGEPHGFVLSNGELRTDDVASDAYAKMVDFFHRTLG